MNFGYYAVLSGLVCWRWGNWRNWKAYYPTMIFFIMGNLAEMVLTQNKPLWKEAGILGEYQTLNLASIVVLYSSTVILFFTFYDKLSSCIKSMGYILLWVAIYSVMEYSVFISGQFEYHNGWTFWYSIIFDVFMFLILILHHKKPLLAWGASIIAVLSLLLLFGIHF